MTLLQRSNQLAENLEQLENKKQLAKEVQTFSSRAIELEQAVQKFNDLVRLVKIFRNHVIPYSFNINLVDLCQALQTISSCYQNDPSTINPNAESSKKFWKPLKDYPAQIHQSLELAWQNYTRKILPSLDKELLDIFEKLPSTQAQVKTIRQLQQQAYDLAISLPSSEQDVDKIKQLVAKIQIAWQDLETTEIPASVLGFLKAACSGGAALHLFTEDVRQWLIAHQLNHAFSISLASLSYR